MKKVSLTIDGRQISADAGTSVLRVALANGIYIPHLCHMESDTEAPASCRLCFVEIAGRERPVTACTEPVAEGMAVSTGGEPARRLQRRGFALLMASHDLDCAHCPANRACELQEIAAHLKVKLKTTNLRKLPPGLPVDDSHPDYRHDPNKCVLCGRCVRICQDGEHAGILGFAYRGFKRRVTTFNDAPLGDFSSEKLADAVRACPTGALSFKEGGKRR